MSEIRPFRTINRRKSRQISVGKVLVGGDAPISVQSMTNTLTTDIKGTVKQINDLEEAAQILLEFLVQMKNLPKR